MMNAAEQRRIVNISNALFYNQQALRRLKQTGEKPEYKKWKESEDERASPD